jgi:hypothetical protein
VQRLGSGVYFLLARYREFIVELAQKSDAEILAVVNPIMDNLMDASTAIDYERHVRDFTDRAKSVLSKESLQAICKHYQSTKGFFAKREFVAAFRRPDSVAVVWRQWFTEHPGEFVAELVLVQSGGRYLVDHVMVF